MTTSSTDSAWLAEISLEQLDRDPVPTFARLRREAPIAWISALHSWIVSSWDDCRDIASDNENYRGYSDGIMDHVAGQPNVLTADCDVHTELRSMINPRLRPRAINTYIDDLVRPGARDLARGLAARTGADLMSSYFEPISVRAWGTCSASGRRTPTPSGGGSTA